ncbi:hypothetical protein SAMN05444673_4378 [Bacillus sp. OV166]|uniref:hypothetical protein n=1 Tax=Bacillus sp. OV166 TaxID=1882763 RepID=UPI000A2AB3EE|nr:hypothetical protein [Bacillus sp. OV166]SMQ81558.1 hypothetical protein SAMN05444673_4378 [Bacillus sp. OV166]
MKTKKSILVFLIVLALGALSPTYTKAMSEEMRWFHQLSRALYERDAKKLNALVEPGVKIPEIRENSPIGGLSTLPSTHKNTVILIGNFKDCMGDNPSDCGDRIAFIWEVSVKNNKISKIKVISDVANPHMNELIVTKEYKEKFNKEILVPMHFPFKMTHVNGKVTDKKIFLQYQNKEIAGVLEIQAEPTAGEIILPKSNMYKPVSLKKGYRGFIGETQKGCELIFLSDNMQYSVKLLGDHKKYNPSKKELIKVVNWMLYPKEPRGMYYEENSDKKFKDADSYYRSLDKKEYVEFKNAKLNIREKTNFENVNTILARAAQYGLVTIHDADVHPKRQVYVYISVSQEGEKRIAIFDAETGYQI